jgi:hypothetical protein
LASGKCRNSPAEISGTSPLKHYCHSAGNKPLGLKRVEKGRRMMMKNRKKLIFTMLVGLAAAGAVHAEWVRVGVTPDGNVVWRNTTTGSEWTCNADMSVCRHTRNAQF